MKINVSKTVLLCHKKAPVLLHFRVWMVPLCVGTSYDADDIISLCFVSLYFTNLKRRVKSFSVKL